MRFHLAGEDVAANTHAAPTPPRSSRPPKMAVSPPADRATDTPCPEGPTAPAPTSLLPSRYQAPVLRVRLTDKEMHELARLLTKLTGEDCGAAYS